MELGEHYHSTHGAVQESMHVFIEAGLRKCDQPALTVFEVGFGTGLNAFLTLADSLKTKQAIRYITVEKYPLTSRVWESLNYPELITGCDSALFRAIHEAPWNSEVQITEYFSILKLSSDLVAIDYAVLPLFDLIFFDAFSPATQPELWTTSIFRPIADHCHPGGLIVTYCAKGAVRRILEEVGFRMMRIPGPPGKREMLKGTKTNE